MSPAGTKRTGQFIKEYLSIHGTASISEIHREYSGPEGKIDELNQGRDRKHKLKKPVYSSFYQYFRHLVFLGLVEKVGEEPTEDIESPEEMGYIQKVNDVLSVHRGAARGIWRLTPQGESEIDAWDDPLRARGYYPRK